MADKKMVPSYLVFDISPLACFRMKLIGFVSPHRYSFYGIRDKFGILT